MQKPRFSPARFTCGFASSPPHLHPGWDEILGVESKGPDVVCLSLDLRAPLLDGLGHQANPYYLTPHPLILSACLLLPCLLLLLTGL